MAALFQDEFNWKRTCWSLWKETWWRAWGNEQPIRIVEQQLLLFGVSPTWCCPLPGMAGWGKDFGRPSLGEMLKFLWQCGWTPEWFPHHSWAGQTTFSCFSVGGEHHPDLSICSAFHSFLHPTFMPLQEQSLFSNKKPLKMVIYIQVRPPFNKRQKY